MAESTIEALIAAVTSAEADIVRLTAEKGDLAQKIRRMETELKATYAALHDIEHPWSHAGLLNNAKRRREEAQHALLVARLPTLTATSSTGARTVRVTSIGAVQMNTNEGRFMRNSDGSWTGAWFDGRIAPIDEAAIRAAVKAAKAVPS